ncbi:MULTISPECIES: nicotinamide riboside transporter PnuC [unclassified Gordonia (in: high G+C Gram-positive bacteria)]|uniref:nicotinamide riboside transporter PnuC n=1 Tax=unclassified Gordonia (in: high G+C Gram-positive bacteria) TaxID=2657482 RepID=UPI001F0628FA|nr:nicotinamide riboside transporter PnuC [Gordonia sp. PDNC005]
MAQNHEGSAMNVIDMLNTTVFTIGNQPLTAVEVLGFVTGALCVWAVTRQLRWNWPIGIANNVVFIVLFLGAGLYADTALQVIFAVLGLYGWWMWRRAASASDLPVRRVTPIEAVAGGLATAAGTVAVALLLHSQTDSTVPWPDAFILAASLLATWGQARKIIEQWWVWIVVDIVSIPLYVHKGLWLTAILYAGFLCLCIDGLRRWRRDLAAQAGTPDVVVVG